jgi:hypothetical protein
LNKLRFGFDLDNTIIDYNKAAYIYSRDNLPDEAYSIFELRNYLTNSGNKDSWTTAQSWLYTEGLKYSVLSPGVLDIFEYLLKRDYELVILSHKTRFTPKRYGRLPLREFAKNWLNSSPLINFFPGMNNIHFVDSLPKKVSLIKSLKILFYVDDLLKIFNSPEYPKNTVKSFIYQSQETLPKWLNKLDHFKEIEKYIK